ncbi:uncharacterized protein OE_1134F [Halobacterium salinarum R1]|uniref:Uncharacterized protein n=2 Tax=Halobacterium salinarum NRC-34001 TaxID=2886895 RepID=A0A510N3U6_HALSA|nr:uncharacterized protein OE_1134F [Halobacterium salinarum R1]DAC77398.1 TPA_inf: uncharacterized protein VNG_0077a [Halobacterium salinarum NRC-1]
MAALHERTTNAIGKSRIANIARTVVATTTAFVRESYLYQWLTAEPDPEVVVIDLRETYTVGPFIAILDRSIETLVPIYRESRLARSLNGLATLLARAADTRPGRVLVALFEPPEPPAGDDSHDAAASQSDTSGNVPDRDTE